MTREEFAKTIDYAMLWQNTPRDLLKKRCAQIRKPALALKLRRNGGRSEV